MIRRYRRCRGLRLFRWRRFQVEAWWFPKGETIETHVHQNIDSHIMLLFGRMRGNINGRIGYPRLFKSYRVPHNEIHGALAERSCLFLNFEWWICDDVSSAAHDFTAV